MGSLLFAYDQYFLLSAALELPSPQRQKVEGSLVTLSVSRQCEREKESERERGREREREKDKERRWERKKEREGKREKEAKSETERFQTLWTPACSSMYTSLFFDVLLGVSLTSRIGCTDNRKREFTPPFSTSLLAVNYCIWGNV